MAADLIVLVKGRADQAWGVIAGPTDQAGAAAAVQSYVAAQPGARFAVARILQTSKVSLTVTPDAAPDLTP